MIVSLERALSKLGYCSRSKAAELIEFGKVCVDGRLVSSPNKRVGLDSLITVDGKKITRNKTVWLMLNKPKNVITTRNDPEGRKTVYDFIKLNSHLFPVGRLDYDTSGLLLMTNESKLADEISLPESKVSKVYLAKVKGSVDLGLLRKGAVLEGELLIPKNIVLIKNNPNSSILEITITEGKNRQIKRMFQAFGIKLLSLKRIGIGSLNLGSLKPGESRLLNGNDLRKLKSK